MDFGVYSVPRYISRVQTTTMGLIQGVDSRSFINKECFAIGVRYPCVFRLYLRTIIPRKY
jgi:hypothetical protein